MTGTTLEESIQRATERELGETIPGSFAEKTVLSHLRKICVNEEEEQVVISVYLRRKLETKVAAKKTKRKQ